MGPRLVRGLTALWLLLAVAVVASAPTLFTSHSRGAGPAAAAEQTVRVERGEVAVSEPAPPTAPLAGRVRDLPARTYDPRAHAGPVRLPVRVRIQALGVDAPVVDAGVEANGEMEVPDARTVGWYRYSPVPGEAGTSVLAAHIAYNGRNGVFRELDAVPGGALVEVIYDDGTTAAFRVESGAQYLKTALPDDIFSGTGPPRLALITCGGEFDARARSYRSNTVVYASPL